MRLATFFFTNQRQGLPLSSMKRSFLPILALSATIAASNGVAVINWVTTNGDAGFTAGSAATNSPVTTDADGDAIVGSFSGVTLSEGETITLTGSWSITGNTGLIPGNQIRWGLFDAPGTPATGNGSGYVGVWAAASSNIDSANGSTTNPFSGSASTTIAGGSGTLPSYGSTYNFLLAVTRVDATQISVSGSLEDAGSGSALISWPETTGTPAGGSFTFDSVGILLGGTTNATQATFSNVDATVTAIPEPSALLLGLVATLGLLRRRR
jgi:hypothetical protein